MDRSQGVDRLQFDDEDVGDDEVQAAFADAAAFVGDFNPRLSCEGKASLAELDAERVFVDPFTEAGSQNPVNLEGSIEHSLCQLINPGGRLLSWRRGVVAILHVLPIGRRASGVA
jgi:hypothetical protein